MERYELKVDFDTFKVIKYEKNNNESPGFFSNVPFEELTDKVSELVGELFETKPQIKNIDGFDKTTASSEELYLLVNDKSVELYIKDWKDSDISHPSILGMYHGIIDFFVETLATEEWKTSVKNIEKIVENDSTLTDEKQQYDELLRRVNEMMEKDELF